MQHAPSDMQGLIQKLRPSSPTARNSRAMLHFAPSTVDHSFHLVLSVGHWITDGRGAFRILGHIVRKLNTPPHVAYIWGEEVCRLSIPLGIASGRRTAVGNGVEPLPEGDVKAVFEAVGKLQAASQPSLAGLVGTHNLPQQDPEVIDDLVLSTSDTYCLLELCRAHGVTMTALLNVVFASSAIIAPSRLSGMKTVPLPNFSVDRSDILLPRYRDSVGLNLVLAPYVICADLIRSCTDESDAKMRLEAVWAAARSSNDTLKKLAVSFFFSLCRDVQADSSQSDDVGIVFAHDIVPVILSSLLAGDAAAMYLDGTPNVTSVGRIATALYQTDQDSTIPGDVQPKWRVTFVANSFTTRLFRPIAHFWEWEGRTTIRIVAIGEYNKIHPVVDMRKMMASCIQDLLDTRHVSQYVSRGQAS
jgi:hypothetical protein